MNVEIGTEAAQFPFLEIFVSNFRYWVLVQCRPLVIHTLDTTNLVFASSTNSSFVVTRVILVLKKREIWDSGNEQLISNGERFKPAFAERDKKQTMIDLRECGWILAEWLERLTAIAKSRNSPWFAPSILRHSGIWEAADAPVLKKNKVLEKIKKSSCYRSPRISQRTGLKPDMSLLGFLGYGLCLN